MKCFPMFRGNAVIARLPMVLLATTLMITSGCNKIRDLIEPELKITTVASGFNLPIGVEVDQLGRVWVAETGTGKNDGKVSVITPDGTKYPVFTGFDSYAIDNGELEGPSHLLLLNGTLYITGGYSKLYRANVSGYKTGDPAKAASTLAVEDVRAFVLDYDFKNKIYETHLYGIAAGAGGEIYMTDAASNAVLRRAPNGALSVVAEIPNIANPAPIGPHEINSVPTSLLYDGQNLLVTSLTGFPFPMGKASIYKVTPSGKVSYYQQGFTTLVDIETGGRRGRLVMEYGQFGQMGFVPNTGRLLWANGNSITELADGLNTPAGLKQVNDHTWYVTSTGDGSLLKVTYK